MSLVIWWSSAGCLSYTPYPSPPTSDAFSWDKGVAKAILSLVGIDIILLVLLMVFDRPQADVVRPNRYPPTDNNNEGMRWMRLGGWLVSVFWCVLR